MTNSRKRNTASSQRRPTTNQTIAVTAQSIPGPAQPPIIKSRAPIIRKLRYTGLATNVATGFTPAKIKTDFGLPSTVSQFYIHRLQAYAMATTTANASITVSETSSERTFIDSSPIGTTPARVGVQFSPLQCITAVYSNDEATTLFTVTYAGASSVLDLTVQYLG